MAERTRSDREIYYLLCRIDGGYQPNAEEVTKLQNRKVLEFSDNDKITNLPNSIGRLSALHTLNLSHTEVSTLPESIGQLSALKHLILSTPHFKVLPESIGQLVNLQTLILCNTHISSLPDSIGQLVNLQTLNLDHASITILPETIGQLRSLQHLNLHMTCITSLPESIGQLSALRSLLLGRSKIKLLPNTICDLMSLLKLDLHKTPISALPEAFGKLHSLMILDLQYSKIAALPESICHLTSLQQLFLSSTQLSSLPESLGGLISLTDLDIRDTAVCELPRSIEKLSALKRLSIGGTKICVLPDYIQNLTSLESLGISNTKIASIPDWLGEMPHLIHLNMMMLKIPSIPKSLGLKGLPFLDIPVFQSDKVGINIYRTTLTEQEEYIFLYHPELIHSLYKDQTTLRECRVLFLGDGDSGKTYTIQRIRNNCKKESKQFLYPTKETPGVEIANYHVERDDDSFNIHFWDFGGQEILHSMHRCFLTDNTCYVVTVKSRETKGTQRARYWLRNATAFAPNSPILLYINCWDNDDGERAIDESRLREDYPNIVGVVYVSAKESEEVVFREKLLTPIVEMAAGSEGCTRRVNQNWLRVRQSIEKESKNKHFLTKEQYHRLCAVNQIENESAPALLSYFNSLGICFSYHRGEDKKELADYKLLNPVWLTNAVYAIIEEGMVYAQDGRIPIAAVEDLLGKPTQQPRRTKPRLRYSPEECRYVIDVAAAYNLSYRVDDELLFFPALCKNDTPAEALGKQADFPEHVQYRFVFDYLPDTLLHRLIIRCMKKGLAVRKTWLRGLILDKLDTHRAILRMEDDETLILDLWHKADHPAWAFFPQLRDEILSIGNDLGLPVPAEQIAKPLSVEQDYKKTTEKADIFLMTQLVCAYQEGMENWWGSVSGIKYSVTELLSPFFDAWTLARLEITDGRLQIKEKYEYHRYLKSNRWVRRAIWMAYDQKCVYCGDTLMPKQVEIDHILATNRKLTEDAETKKYLATLKSRGFDLNKPDYIENYMLSCKNCNDRKNAETWTVENLRHFHELALKRTPQVLERMETFRREMQEDSFE